MARHDKREAFLLFHFIEYGHDGATGVAENIFYALVPQGLENQFRSFHDPPHVAFVIYSYQQTLA